uniref:MPN domain-containing protein n=1 Tax=Chromera velia CCMP2878 TaxID=1169474 RepID=A0A0G4G5G1_9ALVE|eukprot:Cvel_4175.t1-p1 / transcript=Cvel_4175.t1 / gene=Cvel_4175 / organism=Chromera_velia_CCMP2878 / gene_product=AMSH-like ubiquitin thioesterase 1, putative / transcript_product=AMSH-like ubiquitin thioesterase 1, putative / location=Cvel_scaffold180:15710-20541(+) / protein_length=473 / sequence_SO=supercontig / SO=protein_coding / is_pseudo=false
MGTPGDLHIQHLKRKARLDEKCNNSIPLHRYLQTMNQLEVVIAEYQASGRDADHIWLYMYRYCQMLSYCIRHHNAYSQKTYARDVAHLERCAKTYIEELEKMKDAIVEKVNRQAQAQQRQPAHAPSAPPPMEPPNLHSHSNGRVVEDSPPAGKRSSHSQSQSPTRGFLMYGPQGGDEAGIGLFNKHTAEGAEDQTGPRILQQEREEGRRQMADPPGGGAGGYALLAELARRGSQQTLTPGHSHTPAASTSAFPQSPAKSHSRPSASSVPPQHLSPLAPSALSDLAIGTSRIALPCDLLKTFETLAAHNTRTLDVETCGILAGEIFYDGQDGKGRELRITHLIIPKQHATANSCTAECEEDLLMYQLGKGLVTVGWIHTHPSQECFMSSIDLHNQLGYQTLLKEAIAIVVAPTDPRCRCAAFQLSPYGMGYLRNCPRVGFHEHSDARMPLYWEVRKDNLTGGDHKTVLVDLRKS